jgi:hypothetical protein
MFQKNFRQIFVVCFFGFCTRVPVLDCKKISPRLFTALVGDVSGFIHCVKILLKMRYLQGEDAVNE